jgi:hypothetical protein
MPQSSVGWQFKQHHSGIASRLSRERYASTFISHPSQLMASPLRNAADSPQQSSIPKCSCMVCIWQHVGIAAAYCSSVISALPHNAQSSGTGLLRAEFSLFIILAPSVCLVAVFASPLSSVVRLSGE